MDFNQKSHKVSPLDIVALLSSSSSSSQGCFIYFEGKERE